MKDLERTLSNVPLEWAQRKVFFYVFYSCLNQLANLDISQDKIYVNFERERHERDSNPDLCDAGVVLSLPVELSG